MDNFGKKKIIWHEPKELKNSFSKFGGTLNRLILLETVWNNVLGSKAKYWVLDAVKDGTVYAKVNVMTARHELKLKEKEIIKELNKNFEKPWIKRILVI